MDSNTCDKEIKCWLGPGCEADENFKYVVSSVVHCQEMSKRSKGGYRIHYEGLQFCGKFLVTLAC